MRSAAILLFLAGWDWPVTTQITEVELTNDGVHVEFSKRDWYYDGRWGNLAGYQPATGELIGVFVVAGNLRGVKDGSQSPVKERSNVVLVKMPDINGAKYTL